MTRKSERPYEILVCICVGKIDVATALAVIENGNATYTSGFITKEHLLASANKFDAVMASHVLEGEQIRNDTMLEEFKKLGVHTPRGGSVKYRGGFDFRRRSEYRDTMTKNALREKLLQLGFSTNPVHSDLHYQHLLRIEPRGGVILGGKLDV